MSMWFKQACMSFICFLDHLGISRRCSYCNRKRTLQRNICGWWQQSTVRWESSVTRSCIRCQLGTRWQNLLSRLTRSLTSSGRLLVEQDQCLMSKRKNLQDGWLFQITLLPIQDCSMRLLIMQICVQCCCLPTNLTRLWTTVVHYGPTSLRYGKVKSFQAHFNRPSRNRPRRLKPSNQCSWAASVTSTGITLKP